MSRKDKPPIVLKENLYIAFAQIAFQNYKKIQSQISHLNELSSQIRKIKPALIEIPSGDVYREYLELRNELSYAGFITIVFSAITLEAYLLDYGARKLGYSFAKKHFERLKIEEKLIIIPQLFTGKPFPKDRQAYQYVKELISARRWLVHYKPKIYRIDRDTYTFDDDVKADPKSLIKIASNAIRALELLAEEIEGLDPSEDATKRIVPWLKSKEKKGEGE